MANLKNDSTVSNGVFKTAPTWPTPVVKPSENTRTAKLRALARGSVSSAGPLAISGAPKFDESTKPVLAPVASDGTVDGLLLASISTDDLTIVITIPPTDEYPLKATDALYLLVDTTDYKLGTFIRVMDQATDVPGFDVLDAKLLATLRTEGAHTLYFAFRDTVGKAELSAPTQFFVDLTAPGGQVDFAPPHFVEALMIEMKEDGITSALLDRYPSGLPAEVLSYDGIALDDVIVPYVDDVAGPPVSVTDPNLKSSIALAYSQQQIISASDGHRKFQYQITDRAGNQGVMSLSEDFDTLLAGAITDLVEPPVAAMVSGKLIIEEEARVGIDVTIPAHIKVLAGLYVFVKWGAIELSPAPILKDNSAQDVRVTVDQVFEQGSGIFDVSYEIKQQTSSGKFLLMGVSPATSVEVNLDTSGGVDPDPTTPWNENLPLPIIKGGSTDAIDNQLEEDDSTLAASCTIPWMNRATPPAPAFKEGDIIAVYWNDVPVEGGGTGGTPVASYTVKNTDETATPPGFAPLSIAAVDHSRFVGPDIKVSYRASRTISAGVFNHAASEIILVSVTGPGTPPGGAGGLPEVVWTEQIEMLEPYEGNFMLDKLLSLDGQVVEIPYYENKKENDLIEYEYISSAGGFLGNGTPVEVAVTKVTDSYTVPFAEINSPSLITLPIEAFFYSIAAEPIHSPGIYGVGKIKYSVTPEGSSTATPRAETIIYLDTRNPL